MEEKEVIKNKCGEPRPQNAGTQAQLKAEVGFSAAREGPVRSSCHCNLLIGNNWDCLKPQSPELAAAASTKKHLSPSPMATVQPPPPPAGGARSTPSTPHPQDHGWPGEPTPPLGAGDKPGDAGDGGRTGERQHVEAASRHEGPWENLLELGFFAAYTNGSFVLLVCWCIIKMGFIYLFLFLRYKGERGELRQ